jgi:hypothetical protein
VTTPTRPQVTAHNSNKHTHTQPPIHTPHPIPIPTHHTTLRKHTRHTKHSHTRLHCITPTSTPPTRLAARKCRAKKNEQLNQLQATMTELFHKNEEYKAQVSVVAIVHKG